MSVRDELQELEADCLRKIKAGLRDPLLWPALTFSQRVQRALRLGKAVGSEFAGYLSAPELRQLGAWLPPSLAEIAGPPQALTFRPVEPFTYVQPWFISVGDNAHLLESSHEGLGLIWLALRNPGDPVDATALLGRRGPPAALLTRRERETWYLKRANTWRHSCSVNARHVIEAATTAIAEVALPLAGELKFKVSRDAAVRYIGAERIATA